MHFESNREWEQGTFLWNPELQHRTTFLFAGDYFGADGYHEEGRYYMNNLLSDICYTNETLNFTDETRLQHQSPQHEAIKNKLKQIKALTMYWGLIPSNE
jgi:hypothetical protein